MKKRVICSKEDWIRMDREEAARKECKLNKKKPFTRFQWLLISLGFKGVKQMNPIAYRYIIDLFFLDLVENRRKIKKLIKKNILRKNTIKTCGDADYLITSQSLNKKQINAIRSKQGEIH